MEADSNENAPDCVEPPIERLSLDEAKERYPDQFVVFVDFDWIDGDEDGDFRTARVLAHARTRKEAYDYARPLMTLFHQVWTVWTGEARIPLWFQLGSMSRRV